MRYTTIASAEPSITKILKDLVSTLEKKLGLTKGYSYNDIHSCGKGTALERKIVSSYDQYRRRGNFRSSLLEMVRKYGVTLPLRYSLGMAVQTWVDDTDAQTTKDIFKYRLEAKPADKKVTATVLYRTLFISTKQNEVLKSGKTITLKGDFFASFTKSKKYAKEFLDTYTDMYPNKVGIIIKKKTTDLDILVNVNSLLSNLGLTNEEYAHEQEVLVLDNEHSLSFNIKEVLP
jgi:hypothetical protein